MPAKSPFTKAQNELLRDAAKKARKRFKTQEEMALALGISQPSLSNFLKGKWHPGMTTAKAIAHVNGMTLEALIGEYSDPDESLHPTEPEVRYPNLDVCLRFFSAEKTWSPWTIAAARAGFFGAADMPPPAWQEKLDALERALVAARPDKNRREN